jgi:Zn-dependent peptidase ImmA (M78 family)
MLSEHKIKTVENIALDTLSGSKALGVFPTPVDKILDYANLKVSSGVDLSKVNNSFFNKADIQVRRGMIKLRGVLDRKDKTVYLDLTQLGVRKTFVKLHEAGHELCPWQEKLQNCLDDDETLDPDINELFEAEANLFASASLFQLGIFSDKMAELPLEMNSAILLSKTFGASVHATLRRYVEKNPKRCALLVLKKDEDKTFNLSKLYVRNYFQSNSFTKDWGTIAWANEIGIEVPFVLDYLVGRKHYKSEIEILSQDMKSVNCNYYYFDNTYNIFVLIVPKGEIIRSKTKIYLNT